MNAGGGANHMCMIGGRLHSGVWQAVKLESQVWSIDIGIDRITNVT